MSVPTPASIKQQHDENRANGITPPVVISKDTSKSFGRPSKSKNQPLKDNQDLKALMTSLTRSSGSSGERKSPARPSTSARSAGNKKVSK